MIQFLSFESLLELLYQIEKQQWLRKSFIFLVKGLLNSVWSDVIYTSVEICPVLKRLHNYNCKDHPFIYLDNTEGYIMLFELVMYVFDNLDGLGELVGRIHAYMFIVTFLCLRGSISTGCMVLLQNFICFCL